MTVFVKAAELGSFVKAGAALNISPPAVTRAISALEDHLGARLFIRTTRSLRLTEAGARYLVDCTRILAELQEAEDAAAGSFAMPQGHLAFTASVMFGQLYMMEIARAFIDANPRVSLSALLVDRIVNLVDEGVDVAIRIGPLPDSSLTAVKVGSVRRVLCGAPSYFSRHGIPERPSDLKGRRYVGFASAPTVDLDFGAEGQLEKVTVAPAIAVTTNEAAIECALAGWALIRVLSYQVAHHIEAGRLLPVLSAHEPAPWPVHVVHQEGRRASAKVRAFVDFTVEALRRHPLLAMAGGF